MTDRTVVSLPGRSFGPFVPQVFLPAMAAVRRGAEMISLEWSTEIGTEPDAMVDEVGAEVRPRLEPLDPSRTVVVGKSLGTCAAEVVADLGLPAIWVTPLLRADRVVEALRRSSAPMLLVGGTGDQLWDGRTARSLTTHVCELPGADHGLFLPGPLVDSVANLGLLADASERFLDEVVWSNR